MPSSDWAPTVSGVGALLRSRTKQAITGAELGTFTNADENGAGFTRPTADEVTVLLDQATGDVVSDVGADLPTVFWDRARFLVELGTALLIELTYFPEQVGSGKSTYAQLLALYTDRLKKLQTAVADYTDPNALPGEEGSGDGAEPGMFARFCFPVDRGGLVTWRTRW